MGGRKVTIEAAEHTENAKKTTDKGRKGNEEK